MQMANSVEGRCPFLDYRVAEFAGRLPPRLKMKVLNEKYILKRATSDLLPAFLQTRPKQPYRRHGGAQLLRHRRSGAPASTGSTRCSRREPSRPPACSTPGRWRSWRRRRGKGSVVGVKDAMALVSILSTQLTVAQFTKDLRKIA